MYDVCIIGAGPAGSTLARLLSPRYRVLLADRHRLDLPPDQSTGKVCGGLLAPRAQETFARMGLAVPAQVITGPQPLAVRVLDIPARLERFYRRMYINVDRPSFDRWLLDLVPDRVDRVPGWRAVSLDAGSPHLVRFELADGGQASVTARVVVGADGARSFVRHAAMPNRVPSRRYVAVQGTFVGASEPYYGAIFDERITDFYGWTIPKGDHTLVGVALPAEGRQVLGGYEAFVREVRRSGLAIGEETARSGTLLERSLSLSDVALWHNGVALVGEAAGLISPSSAEGISFAMRSADALARSLEPGIQGAGMRYRMLTAGLLAEMSVKHVKAGVIDSALLRRGLMRSGLGSLAPWPGPGMVPVIG